MKSIALRTNHPVIMFNPGSGVVKNPEGKFVFVGQVYGTMTINKNTEKIQELLQLFPRLNDVELKAAEDGIYTWLLYSVGNSDEIRFVCTKVVSPYEIGTRHQALAYNSRVKAAKIYGGGELIKTGESIKFNLLSGTYSKPLIEFNFNKKTTNGIIDKFKSFFPDAEYDSSKDSYINNVRLVSNELLEVYKKYGYVVRLLDTNNEWAEFSNRFWRIDFGIEYYQKKVADSDEKDKAVHIQLYAEALKNMKELLEKGVVDKKGGKRKTRRRTLKGRR